MTAVIETAAPVAPESVTTLDGETRAVVKSWPDGAWDCPFCHYPTRPDTGRRGWDGPCDNPMCVVGGSMTPTGTAQYRERIAERERREEQKRAREAEEQRKRDRQEQIRRERQAARDALVGEAAQLGGFAWACFHGDDSEAGDGSSVHASGYDRAEYVDHMHEHGGPKTLGGPPKRTKLPKRAPKASLPKLPCSPFKFITWEQSVTVHDEMGRPDHTETAERRGQFWAVGPNAHSVWVLPYEPSPWEAAVGITRAKPELVYCGSPGRFFQDSYSAKYDRR